MAPSCQALEHGCLEFLYMKSCLPPHGFLTSVHPSHLSLTSLTPPSWSHGLCTAPGAPKPCPCFLPLQKQAEALPRQGASQAGNLGCNSTVGFHLLSKPSSKELQRLHGLTFKQLASCFVPQSRCTSERPSCFPCWAWMSPTLTQLLPNPKPPIPFMFLYFSLSGLTFVPISPWVPGEQGWSASSAMLRSPCGGLNTPVLPHVKENSAFNGSPG